MRPFLQSAASRLLPALVLFALAPLATPTASAQQFIDQGRVEDVLQMYRTPIEDIPEVFYRYFELYDRRGNNVLARNTFYKVIGEGSMELGRMRAPLVEMLNRTQLQNHNVGDTLVIPSRFELDFRAYSPFPLYYEGGRDFDKLFIIDKSVQAFAAYSYGELQRWGLVNTGAEGSRTPNGRFNFNWKEEYRVSTLSPPGEEWEMYWMFNFHEARGIHIHQYSMPTGGPRSHGCVRLVDADARWIYNWADGWTVANGRTDVGSLNSRIIEQGTTVLVLGDDPEGKPQPFHFGERAPLMRSVELPADPYAVPPGTPQQERFDRLRLSRSSR
jgi:hypothetical protein